MTSLRTQRFLDELRARPVRCDCGARAWPRSWMKNTRIAAVNAGLVSDCCADTDTTHVYLKFPVTVTAPRE